MSILESTIPFFANHPASPIPHQLSTALCVKMTKLNMDLLNRDLLNRDLLYALNAQYLLMCNSYLRQSQQSGYLSSGGQFTDLKGRQIGLPTSQKAIDLVGSAEDAAKKKIDFSNLAQSILAEQTRNGLLAFPRLSSELDKKAQNQLSLSSSSSSSFLQTDLSSSSFSSNSSQMQLCSSPVQLNPPVASPSTGSLPTGRQSNNPLGDHLNEHHLNDQLNDHQLNEHKLNEHRFNNQLNSLNRNSANSSHLTGSQSSILPQLTSNFNQLNLQQFNRSASLTATPYFGKQLGGQFNLPNNFDLENKLITDKLISDKFMNDKLMNDKFMNDNFMNDKFMNDKFMNDKFLSNYSTPSDKYLSSCSPRDKCPAKFDFNACANQLMSHSQLLEKNGDLLLNNRQLISSLHKKSQNENNSLTINKAEKKRADHLTGAMFCASSAAMQSKLAGSPTKFVSQVRKTNRPKKQYICKYCYRAFTKSYNLTIHERTHTSRFSLFNRLYYIESIQSSLSK